MFLFVRFLCFVFSHVSLCFVLVLVFLRISFICVFASFLFFHPLSLSLPRKCEFGSFLEAVAMSTRQRDVYEFSKPHASDCAQRIRWRPGGGDETSNSQSREDTIGVAAAASLAAPFRALARLSLPVRCRSSDSLWQFSPLAFGGALSTCFADGDSTLMPPQICEVVKPVASNVHSCCNRTTGGTECQNTYPRNTDLTAAHATSVGAHKSFGFFFALEITPFKDFRTLHCNVLFEWEQRQHSLQSTIAAQPLQ